MKPCTLFDDVKDVCSLCELSHHQNVIYVMLSVEVYVLVVPLLID